MGQKDQTGKQNIFDFAYDRFGYKVTLVHQARVNSTQKVIRDEFTKLWKDMNELAVDLKDGKYKNQVSVLIH